MKNVRPVIRIELLILILVCFSCSNEQLSEEILEFSKINSLSLQLPENTPGTSISLQEANIGGRECILFVEKERNCIIQFFVDELGEPIEHCFPVEGPNSPGQIYGVSSTGSDTLVVSSIKPNLYFYSPSSKSLKKISLVDIPGFQFSPGNFTTKYPERYVVVNNVGYFLNNGMSQSTNVGLSKPDYKPIIAVDQTNWELDVPSFVFPADYHSGRQYLSLSSMDGDDEKIVYSLLSSHYVHIYYPDSREAERYEAKSKYIQDVLPEFANDSNQDRMEYFAIQPYYTGIIFDSYRDLYYRIAKSPALEDHSFILERKNMYYFNPRQFSIIVMDKELNVLGEHLFPADTYAMRNIVVLKEGLALSKMHPMNKNTQFEDRLEFDVFLWGQ